MELTKRELKMLRMLANGASSEEIAAALGLATGTTRVYLHKLYRKINVKNRTQAAIWFIRKGQAK